MKRINFKITFITEFGIAIANRKAKRTEFDAEEIFKNILNSLPKRCENWESIEFEFEDKVLTVCRHHLIETDFDFWQSVEME